MNAIPTYDLELRAAEDRRRLHDSVEELRSRLRSALDVNRTARQHLGLFCAAAALFGLAAGYLAAGAVVRR
ncbi:MAG TPA: hypothetical protein VFB00_06830 [Terriglobales bacterium]|nr:hypothetical protein [Terriglobales bacterium]